MIYADIVDLVPPWESGLRKVSPIVAAQRQVYQDIMRLAEGVDPGAIPVVQAVPNVRVMHRRDAAKLQISANGVDVKMEVNLVNRGTLTDPVEMPYVRTYFFW